MDLCAHPHPISFRSCLGISTKTPFCPLLCGYLSARSCPHPRPSATQCRFPFLPSRGYPRNPPSRPFQVDISPQNVVVPCLPITPCVPTTHFRWSITDTQSETYALAGAIPVAPADAYLVDNKLVFLQLRRVVLKQVYPLAPPHAHRSTRWTPGLTSSISLLHNRPSPSLPVHTGPVACTRRLKKARF